MKYSSCIRDVSGKCYVTHSKIIAHKMYVGCYYGNRYNRNFTTQYFSWKMMKIYGKNTVIVWKF